MNKRFPQKSSPLLPTVTEVNNNYCSVYTPHTLKSGSRECRKAFFALELPGDDYCKC